MPSYRVTTDKGTVLVKSPKPLDPASMGSILENPPEGVTIDPEAPSLGSMASTLPSGGDEQPFFSGRNMARMGGGIAGAIGGAALAPIVGPAAPLTAIGGAGIGTGLADTAMDALEGKPFDPAQAIKQTGAGMAGEAGTQALAAVARPAARALGLTRTLTPSQEITRQAGKKFDIPLRASEITGSKPTAAIEKVPGLFPTGSGPAQRFSERQATQAVKALRGIASVPEWNPAQVQAEIQRVGAAVQHDIPRALEARDRLASRLYRRVEELAGDEPVVDLGPVISKALALQKEAQVIGGPAAVKTLAEKGTARMPEEMETVLKSLGYAPGEIPPWAQQAMTGGAQDLRVSFKTARRLETELGELSRFGTQTSVAKSRLRALYRQTRDQLDAYLDSPGGVGVKPELAEAKRLTRQSHKLFEQGINHELLKGKPDQIVATAFRPGQLSDLRAFREAVSRPTFEASKIAWLAGLVDKATFDGRFQPQKFEKLIRPYLASGQVAEAYGPQVADQMTQLSAVLAKMKHASELAANPSGTAQATGGMQQLRAAGNVALTPGTLLLGGGLVGGVPGVLGAAGTLVAPPLAAKWVLSNPGINFLLTGLSGRFSREALLLATRLAAQGTAQGMTPDGG